MKIICVGRNYAEHAKELKNEVPENPVIFLKPDSALLNMKEPFFIPDFSEDIHYEAEVVVRIDRIGKHIEPQFAHKYYNKISLGIDFTARDIQSQLKSKGLPWELAKAFDRSAAVGKWFPKEKFNMPMQFSLHKNNTLVQQGNTADMLFGIDEIIAFASKYFTLKIGDIIFTGTPAGVGKVQKDDVLTGRLEQEIAFEVKIK